MAITPDWCKAVLPPSPMWSCKTIPGARFPAPIWLSPASIILAILACNTLRASMLAVPFTRVFEYEFNDTKAPELFLPPVKFPLRRDARKRIAVSVRSLHTAGKWERGARGDATRAGSGARNGGLLVELRQETRHQRRRLA